MFPTFKSKDEIPKGFEDAYEENGGEWVPKVEDTTDLKTALADERTKREAAEKLTAKTAAELKKLETKAKAAEAGVTDEQLQKLREDVRKDLEAEYAPFKETAEKASAENRTLKLDNAVRETMAKNGVRAERLDAAWKQWSDRFDLTADGKPMVKDKPGIEVAKYITDTLKNEIADFFVGTQAAGGGAAGFTTTPVTPGKLDANATPEARLIAARVAGLTE